MKINKIYCLDALKFLATKVDDDSVDLAVVDPPYNLKIADWDTFPDQRGFLHFTYSWLELLIPKIKDTGSLYVFNTPFNAAYILQFLVGKKMVFQNWIVWDKKDGMATAKRRYVNGQETILFFTKSGKHIFNCDDIRMPYESAERMKHAEKKGILKNGKRWYPNARGKLCREVWQFSSERHKRKVNGKLRAMPHLTPKPMDMIERIIMASSNKSDLVLDCFMGSGTTAVASKRLDRNYIGCENNCDYFNLCQKNIKEVISP